MKLKILILSWINRVLGVSTMAYSIYLMNDGFLAFGVLAFLFSLEFIIHLELLLYLKDGGKINITIHLGFGFYFYLATDEEENKKYLNGGIYRIKIDK